MIYLSPKNIQYLKESYPNRSYIMVKLQIFANNVELYFGLTKKLDIKEIETKILFLNTMLQRRKN